MASPLLLPVSCFSCRRWALWTCPRSWACRGCSQTTTCWHWRRWGSAGAGCHGCGIVALFVHCGQLCARVCVITATAARLRPALHHPAVQAEVLKMDRYKAPRDKLLCLVNVKTMVENIVGLAAKAGAAIGGERQLLGRLSSAGCSAGHNECWACGAAIPSHLIWCACPLQAPTPSSPFSCISSSARGCRTWPPTSSERKGGSTQPGGAGSCPVCLTPALPAWKPGCPAVAGRMHLTVLPDYCWACRYVKRFRARARLSGQFDYMLANLVRKAAGLLACVC